MMRQFVHQILQFCHERGSVWARVGRHGIGKDASGEFGAGCGIGIHCSDEKLLE